MSKERAYAFAEVALASLRKCHAEAEQAFEDDEITDIHIVSNINTVTTQVEIMLDRMEHVL